jgi:RHS repeat-associated protein
MVTAVSYAGVCASGPSAPPATQLQITTSSLQNGTVGQAYSATLSVTGRTPPYTWSLPGNPFSWLSLSASSTTATTDSIAGTPTAAPGQANVTVEVTDSSSPQQTDQAVLSLTVESRTLSQTTVYNYAANSYDNVGNLTGYTDTVMGAWDLTYDSLNRLTSGTPSAGGFSGNNYCWAYDSFGNRIMDLTQNTACPPPPIPGESPSTVYYNGNNQVTFIQNVAPTGLPYDAAGNTLGAVTTVGQTYYFYDGEGRVCAVQSYPFTGGVAAYGYLYDAEGTRVAKGSITPSPNLAAQPLSCDPAANGFQITQNYVLGPSGEELTMLDGNNNWQRTNVYAAGKLIGTYDALGLHFHLEDPLGTRRMQLSGELANIGQPETDIQSLPNGDGLNPFSDQYAPATADDATPLHFTGKERDTESGNDYFGARYYASSMGRFMSPDWASDPRAVP